MDILFCLECFVPEEDKDIAIGIIFDCISFGWEEVDDVSSGETCFRVYYEQQEIIQRLQDALHNGLPSARIIVKEVPNQDWSSSWKEFFTPIHTGQFLILPPWLIDQHKEDSKHKIIIEPKCAFGTGHHATTVLCLEQISALRSTGILVPGMRFFDFGTGTGILSFACALSGLTGIGVDNDPIAIANAHENMSINGIPQEHISFVEGSLEVIEGTSFDVIIANVLANPLIEYAPQIIKSLTPCGVLVLSGILDSQAKAVEAAYSSLGKASLSFSGEWVALSWIRG